ILVALPQMVQRRRGHLVIVSSLDGRRPLPGDGPYAIAKAALSGLVQVLRQELRPVERDQAEVVVPRSGRLLLCADLLSPRVTEWAIARLRLSGRPAPRTYIPQHRCR
ncbi:MAG TPA: SDR family NAD(P)-dependent oxidoreductase, partial [Actinomycetes bacterium]|nr:SDR family NAD(P)-dependent oxidoreductase [Actinomycetes bacterium]